MGRPSIPSGPSPSAASAPWRGRTRTAATSVPCPWQGFWKKAFIFAAGAGMNFLTGLVILLALYAGASGFYVDQISGTAPEFPYQGEAGLLPGDRIYKINGYRTYFSGDANLFLSYSRDTADIEVLRDGVRVHLRDIPRQTCTSTDGATYQGFGVYIHAVQEPGTLGNKLRYTWYQALDFVQLVWFSLVQLFTGGVSVQELSGPVGIVSTITQVGESSPNCADGCPEHCLSGGPYRREPGGDEPAACPRPGRRADLLPAGGSGVAAAVPAEGAGAVSGLREQRRGLWC